MLSVMPVCLFTEGSNVTSTHDAIGQKPVTWDLPTLHYSGILNPIDFLILAR